MLIGSQAFQETPSSHAPAIILAMIPQIAAWGKTMIDGALGAAGTNAAAVGFDKLGNTGVLYKGLETLGGGATLAGIILGAVTVFIIERQLEKAAAFALAGAVLTFFGLIHAEDLGIGQSPVVALSYLGIAAMLFAFAKFAHVAPAEPSEIDPAQPERPGPGGIGGRAIVGAIADRAGRAQRARLQSRRVDPGKPLSPSPPAGGGEAGASRASWSPRRHIRSLRLGRRIPWRRRKGRRYPSAA